jgi:protein associated with RNAse G/E
MARNNPKAVGAGSSGELHPHPPATQKDDSSKKIFCSNATHKIMDQVTVKKLNPAGEETFRYTGRILAQHTDRVVLEAEFNRDDFSIHEITLRRGDRFIETYFTDRWYNVFAIHDRDDNRLMAWYCNIGYPAEVGDGEVSYIDLALDLLVYPDGRQLVLDEDEFAALALSPEVQQQARLALEELQAGFTARFAAGSDIAANSYFDW